MSFPKLLVISNRRCQAGCEDQSLFGSDFNQAGPSELRVAEATFDQGKRKWHLNLFPEDRSDPDNVCHASIGFFASITQAVIGGDQQSQAWIFFVPGYCSPCLEGLDKARQLQQKHGVNVILFSWPSDPREVVCDPEGAYRRTQEAAQLSAVALDRALSSLNRIFVGPIRQSGQCKDFRFSLLAHSLGNFVIQNLVEGSPIYRSDTFPFDNIILHQADVNLMGSQEWIKKMTARVRTYVTTNQTDAVLRMISDLVNPTRLGQATNGIGLNEKIVHVDFTGARNVNNEHWFFGDVIENNIINTFCSRIANGQIGEYCLYADEKEPGRFQAFPIEHFPRDYPR